MKTKLSHHLLAALLTVASPTFGATLTVTNLADSGPGSLREALAAAEDTDTIDIQVSGTILLSSELIVTNAFLTAVGPGADQLRVSGNNNSRVFHVLAGSIELNGMTICEGRVVGSTGAPGMSGENVLGGGLLVDAGAFASFIACVVSNNSVVGGEGGPQAGPGGMSGNGGNGFGGGVASLGNLLVEECRFSGNSASGGDSGPVTDGFAGLGGQGWGGASYVDANVLFLRTTVDHNQAIAGGGAGASGTAAGGGIYNVSTLNVQVCTIVSNAATGGFSDTGGGVANPTAFTDCTIFGNHADVGGGITGGSVLNTILAGNNAAMGPDGSGNIASSGFSLIQDTNGMFLTGGMNNILGQDPLLGPLQDNGDAVPGLTLPTMAPQPASPVLDQGNSNMADQRGVTRPFDTAIPNVAGFPGADIGAVEFDQTSLFVLNNNDSGYGSLRQAILDNQTLGGGYDVEFSSNVTGTIILTSGELVVSDPVNINGPGKDVLAISGNLNGRIFSILDGPTAIRNLTLRDGLKVGSSGGIGQKGVDARGGAVFNQSTLDLSRCLIQSNTVVGGKGGPGGAGSAGDGGRGLGGGVYNTGGDLNLSACILQGNRCIGGDGGMATSGSAGFAGNGLGGGLCTIGGTDVLGFCTLTNNQAEGGQAGIATGGGSPGFGGQALGGGIYTESSMGGLRNTIVGGHAVGGTGGGGDGSGNGGGLYNVNNVSIILWTIASNTVSGSPFDFGGGIANFGMLNITNSTIAGNSADFGGGLSGDAGLANTILAANNADVSGPDASGTITSHDYNLIQDTSGLTLVGATNHNLVGQDPLLLPPADNGDETPTMALKVGSPAIDQGTNFVGFSDQRRAARPFDFVAIPNAVGGDGSDIGAFELGVPALGIRSIPPVVLLFWPFGYGDVTLEGTTETAPPYTWTSITNPPVRADENLEVTQDALEAFKLYRLRTQ